MNESLLDDFDTIAKNQDNGIIIDQWFSSLETDMLSSWKYKFNDGILYMEAPRYDEIFIKKPIPSIVKKIVFASNVRIGFKYKVKDASIFNMFDRANDTVCVGGIFNSTFDGIKEVKNVFLNAATFYGASVKFVNCTLKEVDSGITYIRINPSSKQKLEDLMGIEYVPKHKGGKISISMIDSSLGKQICKAVKRAKQTDLQDILKQFEQWLPNTSMYFYDISYYEDRSGSIHSLLWDGQTGEWKVQTR